MNELFLNAHKGQGASVILEGIHAIKHAYRFGADIEYAITDDKREIIKLAKYIAPDLIDFLEDRLQEVSEKEFLKVFPHTYHGKVAALAKKKENKSLSGRSVWLEDVKLLNNIGASIRVLAARGIRNLIVSGENAALVWHKDVLRASAGLHFALDSIFVFDTSYKAVSFLRVHDYKLIVFDAEGKEIEMGLSTKDNSVFVFGSERYGITDYTKELADKKLSLPMREGVSSLNLATSVAAALYRMDV